MEEKGTEKRAEYGFPEASPSLFALPRISTSIVMGMADFALLFLYTSAYALSGIYAGVALMLGKFSIAFFQFFTGWISDHTQTRWGRRKPYIIVLTPLLAISFVLLMLPGLFLGSNPDEFTIFVWFAVFNVMFQGLYSVTSPYQAWLAELFPVNERPKVSAVQNVFNFLGNSIMTVFSFTVLTSSKEILKADPSNIPSPFLWTVIAFAVMLVVLFYITAFFMPTEPPIEYKTNLKEDLKIILKNKNFIKVTLMQGIASLGWSLGTSQLLTFADEIMQLSLIEYLTLALILIFVLIGGIFIWVKRISSKGKKSTLLTIFAVAAVVFPLSLVGFIPMDSYFIFGVIFIGLAGICIGGWYIFPYLMYADIAEDDMKRDGQMRAGIYTGFPSILLNIFQAFGFYLSGALLSLPPYAFKAGVKSIGYVLWGPVTGVILLISYIFAKYFIKLDFEWEKKVDLIGTFREGLQKDEKK